jgi:hypothetical protein
MLPLVLFAAFCGGQAPTQLVADAPPTSAAAAELDRQNLGHLLTLHRVYVDRLSGGETAVQLRDMIISSLERSKLFAVTENPERADATLRGSAEDLVFTDTFSASDGINAHANAGASTGSGSSYRYSNRQSVSAGAGVGEQESLHTANRKHEAAASVRLVTKDGDVIWSTTQESMGGKFHGASADVAEKITKQLLSDYDKARKGTNK